MTKKQSSQKHFQLFIIFSLVVVLIGGGLFFWYFFGPGKQPMTTPEFGVTFSTKYSRELGLDWREVYSQTLDELQVRLYRLPVYWDEIEQNQGDYQLADVQWMLDEAQKREARVLLTIGRRVPRWPECHEPDWTKNYSEKEIQDFELQMMQVVVEKFRDHPAVYRWQVENEPFFGVFGECPEPDPDFIKEAIMLVRQLDPSHQIVVTDSGELSSWFRAANLADVLGISMYRVTWNSFWGYFYYPLPPAHYTIKGQAVAPLVEDIIVTELQVEPWVPSSILTTKLSEQYRSMNVERMRNNIDYARRTGFSEVYLWGVEWWYWLKQKQQDATMWDEGRQLFNNPES